MTSLTNCRHQRWVCCSPHQAISWHQQGVLQVNWIQNLQIKGLVPWTEEPGGLQSMEWQSVRHDWATNTSAFPIRLPSIYFRYQSKWVVPRLPTTSVWLATNQGFPWPLPPWIWVFAGVAHRTQVNTYLLTYFVVVQLISCVQLFETPWTAAHQAPLSSTLSRSLLKFMFIKSVALSPSLLPASPFAFSLFQHQSVKVLVAQLCLTLCESMDYSPPGFSVHGILQTRILEWVAISFSRGSSRPGDWTRVSCIAGKFFTI